MGLLVYFKSNQNQDITHQLSIAYSCGNLALVQHGNGSIIVFIFRVLRYRRLKSDHNSSFMLQWVDYKNYLKKDGY